jgi:ankyrin repeat protein
MHLTHYSLAFVYVRYHVCCRVCLNYGVENEVSFFTFFMNETPKKKRAAFGAMVQNLQNGTCSGLRSALQCMQITAPLGSSTDTFLQNVQAFSEQLQLLHLLLNDNLVDFTAKSSNNSECIHIVVARGFIECFKVCMDITSKGKNGFSVLHYAAQNGHLAILKLNLNDGRVNPAELNDHGDSATMLAVEAGKHTAVALLLKDIRVLPLQRDKSGLTLLHLAASRNSKQTLELLLNDKRIDPNITDHCKPFRSKEGSGWLGVTATQSPQGAARHAGLRGKHALQYAEESKHVVVAK